MDQQELTNVLCSRFNFSPIQVTLGIRSQFKCEYCDRNLLASVDDFDAWQIDHIVPWSKGGTEDETNLAIACKTCNFIKRNWVPHDDSGPVIERSQQIVVIRDFIAKRRAKKQNDIDGIRRCVMEFLGSPIQSPQFRLPAAESLQPNRSL